MLGWLGLVVAPRWHVARDWAAPVIAPLMIGSVYIWLMASNFSLAPNDAGFGSLAEITLFRSRNCCSLGGFIIWLLICS